MYSMWGSWWFYFIPCIEYQLSRLIELVTRIQYQDIYVGGYYWIGVERLPDNVSYQAGAEKLRNFIYGAGHSCLSFQLRLILCFQLAYFPLLFGCLKVEQDYLIVDCERKEFYRLVIILQGV